MGGHCAASAARAPRQASGGRSPRDLGHASHVLKTGWRWRDVPAVYGPPTTVYNRFTRWSARGIWQRMFERMAAAGPVPDELCLDSTHVKAHRSAQTTKGGPGRKRSASRAGARPARSRPVALALTPGNTPDIHMAIPLLEGLPRPKRLIADKAYDAMTLRRWLKRRKIRAVIPSLATRTFPFPLDRKAYMRRNVIERMWARLKNWRRIATRLMTDLPATAWPGWPWFPSSWLGPE